MPSIAPRHAFRPSVLVVDDDISVRQALSFVLDIEGFQVDVCESGEALLAHPMPPPDCLVVDQRLPNISGIDALAALRKRGVTVPAILITTAPTHMLQDQARAMGVRIMEKPLADGALPLAIRAVLT